MKGIILFLLITLCFTSCMEENDSIVNIENDGIENEERSQESAEQAYNLLQNMIDQSTRSGSNEIEKWYGGAYINEDDILIVRSTDLSLSSKLHLSNIIFEKCDYTMCELNEIREKITSLFNEGDAFVRQHIIVFGVDPKTNSLEVGMDEVSEENKSYFLENISSSLAINFFKCSRPIFTSSELKCGEEIMNLTKKDGNKFFHASLGYRAKKKDTGEIGVVTAGHFISKGQILESGSKDTIGICIESRGMDGYLDAAFCKITDPRFNPTNKIEYMTKPDEDLLSTEVATPPVGRIINMVGYRSKRQSGKVEQDSYNVIANDTTFLRDVLLMTCIPDQGDSGGIVYALNKNTNTRYTVGIISGWYDAYYKIPYQLPIKIGICCKAEVINRLYGLERY